MSFGVRRFDRRDVAPIVLILLAAACASSTTDPSFDAAVERPVYPGGGPRVVFDEGHRNRHVPDDTYAPLARLLRADGFVVAELGSRVDRAALEEARVFVVGAASGANESSDAPAFAEDEADAIRDWVAAGGALLLIADHFPFGPAASGLAARFGVEIGQGYTEDPERHDAASRDPSQLVFRREDGLLGEHPVLDGRGPEEAVRTVVTFTGTSLSVPDGAVALLRLSPTAVDRPPSIQVDSSGMSSRVEVSWGPPRPATDRCQALALELGRGRVVVLGDAAMFAAQIDGGRKVGMNHPGADNRQLALNVVRWLARAI